MLLRSINTTLASALPVISLLLVGAGLFGQVTLREFAIALLVGMLTGAYSSIFVASPLLGWLKARSPAFAGRSAGARHLAGEDLRAVVVAGPGGVRAVSGPPPPGDRRSPTGADAEPDAAPAGGDRRVGTRRPPAHPPAPPAQEEEALDPILGHERLWPMRAVSASDGPAAAWYPWIMSGEATATGTDTALEPAWLRSLVREIPDCPQPGVTFRDITPLLGDAGGFRRAIDELADRFADVEVDRVVGVESRGFILAAPVAYRLGAGVRAGAQGRQAAVGRRARGVPARVRRATSSRSTATPSTPTSGSSSSTTCWPPAARRPPRPAWSRRSAASIVGIGSSSRSPPSAGGRRSATVASRPWRATGRGHRRSRPARGGATTRRPRRPS